MGEVATTGQVVEAGSVSRPPMRPSTPQPLVSLLRGAIEGVGHGMQVSRAWQPQPVPGELRPLVKRHGQALARYLEPANPAWISARVLTLLSHFYVANAPGAVQEGVINDWVAALEPFPAWAIDRVCQDWLASQSDKPKIVDIVAGCKRITGAADAERAALRRLLTAQADPAADRVSPERLAQLAEILEQAGAKP